MQACGVRIAKACDQRQVEVRERGTERRALAQDGDPGQPGLEALERDALEQLAVAVDCHPPLVVVVRLVERIAVAEAAQCCGRSGLSGWGLLVSGHAWSLPRTPDSRVRFSTVSGVRRRQRVSLRRVVRDFGWAGFRCRGTSNHALGEPATTDSRPSWTAAMICSSGTGLGPTRAASASRSASLRSGPSVMTAAYSCSSSATPC